MLGFEAPGRGGGGSAREEQMPGFPPGGCPRVRAASAHTPVCFPLGSPAKSCGGSSPAKGRSLRKAHEMLSRPHLQARVQIVLAPCRAHSQARAAWPRARASFPEVPLPDAITISAPALPPPCPSPSPSRHLSGPPRRLWRPRPGKAPPGPFTSPDAPTALDQSFLTSFR